MDFQSALFKMSHADFVRLCTKLLEKNGEYRSFEILSEAYDSDIDIKAENKSNHTYTAIECKHKLKISITELEQIIGKLTSLQQYDKYILMTSAQLTQRHYSIAAAHAERVGKPVEILGQQQLIELLTSYPDIYKEIVNPAEKLFKADKRKFIYSTIVSIFAAISAGFIVNSTFLKTMLNEKPSLQREINSVQIALDNLSHLGEQLKLVKSEMENTESKVQAINARYEQALQLQKLSDQQIAAIKMSLETESWHKIVLSLFVGFIMGFASSYAASWVFEYFHKRRELS